MVHILAEIMSLLRHGSKSAVFSGHWA